MIENAADQFNERQRDYLPGLLGIVFEMVQADRVRGRMIIEGRHMAPNGFVHAASVIALLDSACGYGCVMAKPERAIGFTTIELKSNFLATARLGESVIGDAQLIHGGQMTQVWDAVATNQTTGKTMAMFRCTQMILYPK